MVATDTRAHRPSLFGVLYAEDFSDGEDPHPDDADAATEPEIIEPSFCLAELEAARTEARSAALAEAERGLSASRNHMLGLLAAGVAESRAEAHAAALAVAEGVAQCMLGALTACLPGLCERHGPAELAMLTRAILPGLLDEPKIVVRVHPHMLAPMQDEVTALDFELAERVQLVPTEALAPGDARISWGEGSVTRNAAAVLRIVKDALADLGLLQREMNDG